MKKNDKAITREIIFENPKNVVWNALTKVDEMRKWYFENIEEFKTEVGFKTAFDVYSEDRLFRHQWMVIEVIVQTKIVYNWNYPNYDGDANVSFQLEEVSSGTKLEFSMEILADFNDDIPEFKTESCEAGWTYFLNERLANYLKDI